MVWFVASYAGSVLGVLALNAAAGRWLGPDDFGFFVVTLTAAGLLSQVGLVGSHRSGLREVARLRDADDPPAMVVLRNGVRVVCLTTLPLAGLVAGTAAWFLTAGDPPAERLALAVALAVLVVLGGQQQLWANYVRGLGHVRFASLLEGRSGGALVAALQALCVVLVWVLVPGWGLAGAVGAVAAGFLVPTTSAWLVVRHRWHGLVGPPPRLWRDLRRTVGRDWRFLSAQVATFLNGTTEIWLAGLLLTAVDTSMFSAGQRLALLLVLPLTALQVVLAPVVARARAGATERSELERLVRTGATVATALALVLALPIMVAPGLVVGLVFGDGFSRAVPVLLLVSLGSLGNVASGMAGTTLSMLGREDVAARVQWTGVVLRVGLGVPAALVGGLLGLTISALLVSSIVPTVMWWRSRRALGIATHVTLRPELSLLRRTAG
ncbi:lipopolysaccharide biosynthesis protein [uncultured Nocardioides sp.]|uniref:lipopolysaccharide biosynthesis protein n=1 Tax=uncultured Nocardioides sp. TaxID=198441 RepID=UPI0026297C14|nr:lipopolysaccharide biosynthesis protein [uncultured Nocardioides sp.]